MRQLTAAEQETLEKRRQGFDAFFQEMMPVLSDFAGRLGIANSALIVAEPEQFLSAIEEFMKNQTITPQDRIWIQTRLGYFIGEILIRRPGGCWFFVGILACTILLHPCGISFCQPQGL